MECKQMRFLLVISCCALGIMVMLGCSSAVEEPQQRSFDLSTIYKGKGPVIPIVILGGGPAGLAAAIYGASQYETAVIVGGPEPSLLTKTEYVENFPGSPHTLGEELIERTKKQAQEQGAFFIELGVESVDLNQWPYAITLDDERTVYALSLIIALGANPRVLDIPGERDEYGNWSSGVSACARCDARFYKDKEVVVAGGGDAALEEAIELARFARKVTIIHRRAQLRASVAMQMRVKEYPKIEFIYDVHPKEIISNEEGITGVVLVDHQTKKEYTLPTDGFFLAIGHVPNTKLFKDVLALDDQGYIILDDRSQQTNMQGVFAAGDVADPHYRQAITAAGDGARAAIDASKFLESIGFNLAKADELKRRMPKYADK